MLRRRVQFGAIVLAVLGPSLVRAADVPADAERDAAQRKAFETHIRPLLAARCFKCHSDEKQSGNLRLDAKSTMLTGGDTGAALVPGKPKESLIIDAINYETLEMPPSGKL